MRFKEGEHWGAWRRTCIYIEVNSFLCKGFYHLLNTTWLVLFFYDIVVSISCFFIIHLNISKLVSFDILFCRKDFLLFQGSKDHWRPKEDKKDQASFREVHVLFKHVFPFYNLSFQKNIYRSQCPFVSKLSRIMRKGFEGAFFLSTGGILHSGFWRLH